MRTGWLGMHWLRDLTKGYKEDGGTRNYLQKIKVFKVLNLSILQFGDITKA